MGLENYLRQYYTPITVARYLRDIDLYLSIEPDAKQATYHQVMGFIGYLRKTYPNPGTVGRILQGVKKYYNWLQYTGRRKDHPCKYIQLKDNKNKALQPQDLSKKRSWRSYWKPGLTISTGSRQKTRPGTGLSLAY